MNWKCFSVPGNLLLMGIASMTALGIAVSAQSQDETSSSRAKALNKGAESATERSQPGTSLTAPVSAAGNSLAQLGVHLEAKTDKGLSVATIEEKGILAQSGLRRHDTILSADGRAFKNPRELEAYLWGQSGRTVPLTIERDGERHTLQANIPHHAPTSGWLGVFLDEGDAKVHGARVVQVYPSGPAARAGIHVGDVIKQINSKHIVSSVEAVMLLREFQPQTEIVLSIERGMDQLKLPVIVGSRANFAYPHPQAGSQQLTHPGPQTPGHQPQGAVPEFGDAYQFQGVPPYAMQLENDRRMSEQHERIEEELKLLRTEIQKLRELIEKK